MAYQNPAFYAYHALRDSATVTTSPVPTQPNFPLFDGRQGEVFSWAQALSVGDPQAFGELDGSALSVEIDTVIVSGHNWNALDMRVIGYPVTFPTDPTNLLDTDPYLVAEANGVPIIQPMTSIDPMIDLLLTVFDSTTPDPSREPECSEIWFSKKLELTRGPEPNWQHPWTRSQARFENESGVTSTWLKGAARKRFQLTWGNVFGADRQVFFDLQAQTADFSQPFWLRPPDDDYATLLVELDRDALYQQDLANPMVSGTSDRITLPLIEVLG